MPDYDGNCLLAADRIRLDRKKFAHTFTVAEDVFLTVDVGVRHELFNQLAVQFCTEILVDNLPPQKITARHHVTYEVPASTWQMWKLRHGRHWYARWIAARWPARYERDPGGRGTDAVAEVDLERFRAYPRANVALPPDQFGRPVLGHILHSPTWRDEREDFPDA